VLLSYILFRFLLTLLITQAKDTACRVTESEVHGAPEPNTRSITFLTKHQLRAVEVLALPPAEVALVRPANPPEALPALHTPSKVTYLLASALPVYLLTADASNGTTSVMGQNDSFSVPMERLLPRCQF